MKIVIIRHGETLENARMIIQGQQGGTLSPTGIKQARNIGTTLKDILEKGSPVYCSDLNRALQTAGIITENINSKIIPDIRLRERNYGILEGQSFYQLKRLMHIQKKDIYSLQIDGAESFQEFTSRIEVFLDYLFTTPDDSALLVTHQGVVDYIIKSRYPEATHKVPNCSAFVFTGQSKNTLELTEILK